MATTLQVIDTEYSADSVEWCPLNGLKDILLCGTYQLQESQQNDAAEENAKQSQTRVGRLYLHRLEGDPESQTLKNVSSTDMPGILDIKWCTVPIDEQSVFGLVTSVGELQVYKLKSTAVEDGIEQLSVSSLGDDILGLSLDWSNKVSKSSSPRIACSSSDGRITVYQLTNSDVLELSSWNAHGFEAWITAFNYWNENIVYSGGDDCKLKGWDLRQSTEIPAFVSKRHSMGVCSVQSCHLKPNILCTGSYDENLLVWDDRNMKSPLSETSLGGGVWRIKWEPHSADLILTATMYNGFHVLDARDLSGDSLPILCHYKEHSSIAYGADWCFKDSHRKTVSLGDDDQLPSPSRTGAIDDGRTIATCSFYDHCLHLWNYKENIS
ncbi:hypothetical protein FSP39_016585 [Pinctada imbricata]|uniref:methylated diphthine methylhydrolase n=1 Tax=Pinctada imbricata TaxID=66713 RepID=A0AA88XSH2_PINIB|nr:hypothetical protein FSP39_016585 [Pinctada imbricata]